MTAEEMKAALGIAERGLMESKGALDEAVKKLGAAETRSTADATKIVKLEEDYKKINDEHAEIMTKLQAPGVLPGSDPNDERGKLAARAAYVKFMRNSRNDDPRAGMTAEEKEHVFSMPEAREKRSLYVSSDELGGFLVNPVVSSRIVEQVVQISPIRSLATVMSISTGGTIKFTRENGQLTAGWTAERGTRTETTGNQWKGVEIPTHEQYALVRPSYQLLDDVAFNLEAWLETRVSKQMARGEGQAFVSGNGITRPQGILTHPDIVVVGADATAASGQFIPDDVIDLMTQLITEYADFGTVLLKRITLGAMRKFKDTQNRPLDLVQRDVLSKIRAFTVDGYAAKEVVDMPAWGTSSAKLMVFGDVAEGYTIVDRAMMTVIRDPYSRKLEGEVEMLYKRRVGGQVVQPDAFKILQAAA